MKKLPIILIIFLATLALAQINHYYEIQLSYSFGNISYTTVNVKPFETKNPEGNYYAQILSPTNSILQQISFGIPISFHYDLVNPETGFIDGGGTVELNETDITLFLPYHENAKEIRIYNPNQTLELIIPVSSFSSEDAVTAENIELPEEKVAQMEAPTKIKESIIQEITETKPSTQILIGVLIGIGIIILLVFIIVILHKRT